MGLIAGKILRSGKYEYTIEKQISVELTTVSYLAKRSDGNRWIIKVLDPQVLAGLKDHDKDRAKTLFMQESGKLFRCSGTPHIIKSEMPFSDGDLACLPVEYISGDSLAERPQPKLEEDTAIRYIQQLGAALEKVHSTGLVHRDVRPSNIFLKIRGSNAYAVLAGFGLAMDCDTPLTRTRSNELKDGFSPPELYSSGKPVGKYTDVYSLSATLYELLTGEAPANATERVNNDKMYAQAKNSDISGRTSRAIEAGMMLEPEKRPQSVEQWLAQLKVEKKPVAKQTVNSINWPKWEVVIAAIAVMLTFVSMFWDNAQDNTSPSKVEPATTQNDKTIPETDSSVQDSNSPGEKP